MQLRYALGLVLNPTELNPDPAFDTVWPDDGGGPTFYWTTGAGVAQFNVTAGAPAWLITAVWSATAFLTAGTRYRVSFDFQNNNIAVGDTVNFEIFVGYNSTSVCQYRFTSATAPATNVFDLWCTTDSEIVMQASGNNLQAGNFEIDNLSVTAYEWNPYSDFEQFENPKIKIENSQIFEGLKVSYIEDVTFVGADYQYLLSSGINDTINVKIEYYDSGWKDFFYGLVYVNEIKFERNRATCKILNWISEVIKKGSEKPFNIWNFGIWEFPYRNYLTWSFLSLNMHDVGSGAYLFGAYGWNLYYFIRDMIHEITNCFVTFDSPIFKPGAPFEGVALSKGSLMGIPPVTIYPNEFTDMTFMDLFTSMDYVWNLGISFDRIANVNTLTIDYKTSLRSAIALTYSNIPNDSFEYKNDLFYAAVDIGFPYEINFDYESKTVFLSNVVFTHTENRTTRVSSILRGSYLIYTCLTNVPAAVKSQAWATYFFIQYVPGGGSPYNSRDFWPVPIDGFLHGYNGDITFYENMNRFAQILPNGLEYRCAQFLTIAYTGSETLQKLFENVIPINYDDLITIMGNPNILIKYVTSYENTQGYIENFEYEIQTQKATIKLYAE